ncbi:hypothetical protein [Mesorhizobium sp.]|uniref:hypothetical protein n=1 Tax=Mesorhizobium sp. TaxID=1871066 RepID=UPI00257B4BDF|nr:hypothetical protein [Mesorhizobium sp.]
MTDRLYSDPDLVQFYDMGTKAAWTSNDFRHNPATGVVTYSTHYEMPGSGRVLSAESKIAFPTKESLAPMLDQTGLVVEEWLGNWRGEPYAPTSPEIIPIGRLR